MKTETSLDFASHNLNDIPLFILESPNIIKLNLDFNEIAEIPSKMCSNLLNLSILSMKGNKLNSIPSNFGELISLRELYINENDLTKLPESFGNLRLLEKLNLTANNIIELPTTFSEIKNLTTLILSENDLQELPNNFGKLECLIYLDVSYNKIEYLPANFGNLKALKYLNLCDNCLKSLPESFSELPSLESLDISNNGLMDLPSKFFSANTLRKFYAENNILVKLPSWFENLENIQEISLESNYLQHKPFPSNFGIVNQKLEYLYLAGNSIDVLPKNFGNLKKLKFLDLGSPLDELERRRSLSNGNSLVQLPLNFSNLYSLRELHLDENEIKEIPDDFGKLENLTFIDLNHNLIKKLPDSFCNLLSLKICMLSMNFLECLPDNIGKLSNLDDLRLDNNNLTEIPESFEKLSSLSTLDLFNNNLKEIPCCLKKLKNLIRLDLRENNFDLDFNQIPGLEVKPTYTVRKSEWSDNWRGRKRPDILPEYWVKNKDEKHEYKENEEHLYNALAASSSLWRKHKDVVLDKKNTSEEECEYWDIDREISVPNENVKKDGTEIQDSESSFNRNKSEENDENFALDYSSSEDFEDDCLYNNLKTFRRIYKHPTEEKVHIEPLIPSDLHPEVIHLNETSFWDLGYEEGQFDDAYL